MRNYYASLVGILSVFGDVIRIALKPIGSLKVFIAH